MSISKAFAILLLLLAMGVFNALFAQGVYPYHPLSPMRLGEGFDPRKPTAPKIPECVKFKGERNVDSASGAVESGVTISSIANRRSLLTSLGVSTSFDAHYNFGGGDASVGGSFAQISQTSFTEDSLTWVARASVRLGRFQVEGFELGPDGLQIMALPAGQREAAAINACGTETVTQEARGAVAAIYYHVDYIDSGTKTRLEQAITAAASSSSASANASNSYKSALDQASHQGILRFEIFTQGGPGQVFLSSALKDITDINAVRDALATYIKNVSSSNAKPLTWQTSPNSDFGLPTQSAVFTHRDQVLERFNDVYKEIAALNTRIYELIRPPSAPEYDYLADYVNPTKRKELAAAYDKNQEFQSRLFSAAVACIGDTSQCTVPSWVGLPTIVWPPIPTSLTIVFQRVCGPSLHRLLGPGETLRPGDPTGDWKEYQGYVSGDPKIFATLDAIIGGNQFPIAVAKPDPPDERTELLSGLEDCKTLSTGVRDQIGVFRYSVDLYYQQPIEVTFEVRDKLKRRLSFVPPQ